MHTTSLEITGMTCGHCVAAVNKALTRLEGVSAATVEMGRATVTHDPHVATAAAVIDAVENEGYEARVT
jgi:copper chaperone CopZ